MIPKIHKKGASFRGAAQYLLHDLDAKTSERVTWTETRNLATRHADAAWRVMAATAMNQNQLKKTAGVPNTGRKSKQHVLHFTLSWHEEEANDLNREEMMRATMAVLKVMDADSHQALIVAHNDTKQPHVHVLVNRVHPKHGKMLSSSFEKIKASQWAQKYEEERGKIYCVNRVINNEARKRGEYTRGEKDDPRHVHEALEAINDNSRRKQLLEAHRKWAHELKERQRQLQASQDAALAQLEQAYRQNAEELRKQAKSSAEQKVTAIRERYRPYWKQLFYKHQSELEAFERREASLLGRVQNTITSIDFASLVGSSATTDDGRAKTISDVFQVLSSSGMRLQTLKHRQQQEKGKLTMHQKRRELKAQEQAAIIQKQLSQQSRKDFLNQRNELLFVGSMERAKLRTQWRSKRRKLQEEMQAIAVAPVRVENRNIKLKSEAARVKSIPPSASDALAARIKSAQRSIGSCNKNDRTNGQKR